MMQQQYHLYTNGNHRAWQALDSFTQGYIEELFFTEHSPTYSFGDIEADPEAWQQAIEECRSEGSIPADATLADMSPEALLKCIDECRAFQQDNAELLKQACERDGYDMERAGRDYWFTRNSYGTGFWDRDLGDVGDQLHDACRFKIVAVYLGDDGLIRL